MRFMAFIRNMDERLYTYPALIFTGNQLFFRCFTQGPLNLPL